MTFGGEVFNNIVDHASDIFDTLPPPEPSLINNNIYRGVTGTVARPINLAAYNNAVVDVLIVIVLSQWQMVQKRFKKSRKNDFIKSVDKNNNIVNARVVCVVEMKIKMESEKWWILKVVFQLHHGIPSKKQSMDFSSKY